MIMGLFTRKQSRARLDHVLHGQEPPVFPQHVMRILRMLIAMNNRYRRIFLDTGHDQRDMIEEHTAIAEAAAGRDAERAAKLLEAHIERTGTTLRRLLTAHLPEAGA